MLAVIALLSAPAAAQDALTMSAVRYAQHALSSPSVTFHPRVAGTIEASLSCAGRSYSANTAIVPDQDVLIALEGLPEGTHTCRGSLALDAADGTSGEMPLSVQVHVLPPLTVTVARAELDLEERRMQVQTSRPMSKVAVEVFGEKGVRLGSGEVGSAGRKRTELPWNQSEGEALKLVVTAWDEHALPGRVELSPWSYAIPHEDVIFESGRWALRPGEMPKLESAWSDLIGVRDRYGPVVEVNLFVAGYTDTMGASAANESLSWNRAKAIAAWFQQRGFEGQIWYQGFGESVLAVRTPDETDEQANRRALYVLAADQPTTSASFPRAAWKRMR